MMAVDVQPYSVVEYAGFKNLLGIEVPQYSIPNRKYFSTKVVSKMFDSTRSRVQSAVDSAKSICLKTDTWTAHSTTQSFMSLTAHWITDDFVRK